MNCLFIEFSIQYFHTMVTMVTKSMGSKTTDKGDYWMSWKNLETSPNKAGVIQFWFVCLFLRLELYIFSVPTFGT